MGERNAPYDIWNRCFRITSIPVEKKGKGLIQIPTGFAGMILQMWSKSLALGITFALVLSTSSIAESARAEWS